jgi:hypothetical protein
MRPDVADETARRKRVVENERLIRESNWEKSLAVGGAGAEDEHEFHCACGRPECDERLLLTIREYRAAHAHPHRFVVAPGHAEPELERVVERHPHYHVVEKLPQYQGHDPTASG